MGPRVRRLLGPVLVRIKFPKVLLESEVSAAPPSEVPQKASRRARWETPGDSIHTLLRPMLG